MLENPERKFLPGMFVTAHTLDEREAAVTVPPAALQTLDGRSVVFVEAAGGFAPRNVTLGRRGETRVEIVSGLAAGECIVATGSFLLKAELAKGEAEHDH